MKLTKATYLKTEDGSHKLKSASEYVRKMAGFYNYLTHWCRS